MSCRGVPAAVPRRRDSERTEPSRRSASASALPCRGTRRSAAPAPGTRRGRPRLAAARGDAPSTRAFGGRPLRRGSGNAASVASLNAASATRSGRMRRGAAGATSEICSGVLKNAEPAGWRRHRRWRLEIPSVEKLVGVAKSQTAAGHVVVRRTACALVVAGRVAFCRLAFACAALAHFDCERLCCSSFHRPVR